MMSHVVRLVPGQPTVAAAGPRVLDDQEVTVRRVVAGVTEDGRSGVVGDQPPDVVLHASADGELTVLTSAWCGRALRPGESVVHEMWAVPAVPSATTDSLPKADTAGFEVAPGATKWIVTEMGPDVDVPMHQTATVDYGLVVRGAVTMVLESGEVALSHGDGILVAGVRHGWRTGSQGATLATVLVGLPPQKYHAPDVPTPSPAPVGRSR